MTYDAFARANLIPQLRTMWMEERTNQLNLEAPESAGQSEVAELKPMVFGTAGYMGVGPLGRASSVQGLTYNCDLPGKRFHGPSEVKNGIQDGHGA